MMVAWWSWEKTVAQVGSAQGQKKKKQKKQKKKQNHRSGRRKEKKGIGRVLLAERVRLLGCLQKRSARGGFKGEAVAGERTAPVSISHAVRTRRAHGGRYQSSAGGFSPSNRTTSSGGSSSRRYPMPSWAWLREMPWLSWLDIVAIP